MVQAICFVAHPALIRESRRQLERLSNSALVLYCAGSGPLPRGASVEWSVWAHRHNKQFQCKFVLNLYINFFIYFQ